MNDLIMKMKALGEPNRFRIAAMLFDGPQCVCKLLPLLKISGATLTSHLKILKEAGLITSKRNGRWIEYSIANEEVHSLMRELFVYCKDMSQVEADRVELLRNRQL